MMSIQLYTDSRVKEHSTMTKRQTENRSVRLIVVLFALIPFFLSFPANLFAENNPVTPQAIATTEPPAVPSATSVALSDPFPDSYLFRNQKWIEGMRSPTVDLENVDAVFWHIFSQLPADVVVYPTENYYYFVLYANHRQVWGNMRLPIWQSDEGVLSFAYFEFTDFPGESYSRFTKHKMYGPGEGVTIKKTGHFTYQVTYKERSVVFRLNQIAQDPPRLFPLASDEAFVQRTFDESGFQFFLLFNTTRNYFFWALNEEAPVPDDLQPLTEDLLLGQISGFAFWVDKAHGNRKILVSTSRSHGTRNDYFDGPFDQSADNYAEETKFQKYIELAYPYTKGNIDKYGNLIKLESQRVGITAYYLHSSRVHLLEFMNRVKKADDPYQFIFNSRKELFSGPTPTNITPRPEPPKTPVQVPVQAPAQALAPSPLKIE